VPHPVDDIEPTVAARRTSVGPGGHVRAHHLDLGRSTLEETLECEGKLRADVVAGRIDAAIITVEHERTYTVGRAGLRRGYPRGDPRRLPHVRTDVPVVEVDRGGDVTWHGPGQLVVHPVVPIKRLSLSLIGYLRLLESSAIDALATFGVRAHRREGRTGIWVGERKLGFIGIACRRWIAYHGMSINVACDLSAFDAIVPCGIEGCRVTSLAELTGRPPALGEVAVRAVQSLSRQLGVDVYAVEANAAEVAGD
jgi:lipoate-protein ligase B